MMVNLYKAVEALVRSIRKITGQAMRYEKRKEGALHRDEGGLVKHSTKIMFLLVSSLGFIGFFAIGDSMYLGRNEVKYNPSINAISQPNPAPRRKEVRQYEPYCDEPKDREDSDLCAQWAAVGAVTEANQIASIAIWLSFLSIFATAVGAVLVIRSLQQADRSYELSARSLGVQLRAYVSVKESKFDYIVNDSGDIIGCKIRTVWFNTGSTPAVMISAASESFFHAAGTSPDWGKKISDNKSLHNEKSTLGSNQELYTTFDIPVHEMKKVDEGFDLYVWSSCEYRDVFDVNQVHRTEFCNKLMFGASIMNINGSAFAARVGPFNGMDETAYFSPMSA